MKALELPFELPPVGLGTWQMWGETAVRGVGEAIEVGYRHIDTAAGYGNEAAVGAGIRAGGVDREDLLIVTKFPEEDAGRERESLSRSLEALGVDFVDLWLIHAPPPDGGGAAIWEHFVAAREEGLTRAIGVSNFMVSQMDALVADVGVTPQVNQVAFGPRYFEPGFVERHVARGIVPVGHSPFSENDLAHPTLRCVAERHGRSVHDVILRWHWEHKVATVAKSTARARLEANLKAFDFQLKPDEIAAIDRLGLE
ncbi:MAG: aldo/keto reductase [Stackebrandtia sp.]